MKNLNYDQIPSSVYRLQLNREFCFKKAIEILPYLKEIGIEGVYCSPYFKAYSSHGYDVTAPNSLNPHIGTLKDYHQFCKTLQKLDLKHICDVVPNHMGIKGGQNQWWQDVLENGPYSEFASYFDINWSPEKKELQDRVLLPILGGAYGEILENQEITLHYAEGTFMLHYADYPLPVSPGSYALVLEAELESLKKTYKEDDPEWNEYQALIELFCFFPVSSQERVLKKEEGKKRLHALVSGSKKIERHLASLVEMHNGKKHRPFRFDLLDKLLEAQFYRLSYWRVANHEINYRRFFNIHELVSIRIEEETVLENHHKWLFELLEKGYIQGLRIDHPDGLYDPICYFERLRDKFQVLTVVEKILDRKEKLPESWKVEGTVGYEYLNLLNGIFIQQEHERDFSDIYEEFTGQNQDFEEIVYLSKKLFTDFEMVSEVEVLALKLDQISEANREYRDFTRHDLTKALAEVIACFPVYRTYVGPKGRVSKRDAKYITIAVEKAKSRAKDLDASIFDFLETVMLFKLKTNPEQESQYREFVLRFQQLTGPIMAKGLEDTTFYLYNRFISLNEVGGDPPHFGHSIADFHKANLEKMEKWNFGFLSSSTHDTKRSEDVRMRLNVLSEMPEQWRLEVKKWAMINLKHKKGEITSNTEYFIYQTLLGIWPKAPLKQGHYQPFCQRIWDVLLKSIREAKKETSWAFPNSEYEEALRTFFFSILAEEKTNHFLKHFTEFHKKIDRYGSWNSLSQLAIKIGCPGIVDVYQGNELLTYRLVDPDNRVCIDYSKRKKMLLGLKKINIERAFATGDISRVKCFLSSKALQFRKEHKDLFLQGSYLPLRSKGGRKNNVIAFLRQHKERFVIVLAGRYFSQLASAEWDLPLGHHAWGDTEILLPLEYKDLNLVDVFTNNKVQIKKRGNTPSIRLADVFEHLPVSYLYGE